MVVHGVYLRRRRADGQKEGWSWESVTLDMVWLSMVTRADCDGGGGGPGWAEGKVTGQK